MSWNFPYLGETKDLNEISRANASGKFVQLSDGYTHYELGGSEDGQPVVLVHGFSVPFFIWEPTFTFLSSSGFHVLRYDLFGRGFSDRPLLRYDIDLFCKQLRELLDTLGFDRVSVIGLSMGGPITSTFATSYPARVRKLVLVDPAGARDIGGLPGLLKVVTLPGVGELAFGLLGNEIMIKGIASDLYGPDLIAEFQQKFRVQMQYKGFKRALLSTMRYGMLKSFTTTYQCLGTQETPVALFWGREDKTIPFEHSLDLLAAVPQAQFHIIENCGHIPHYEKSEEVNPLLLEFLK